MKEEEFFSIICSDVRLIKRHKMDWAPIDLVFLDPPYGTAMISQTLKHLLKVRWISKDSLIITEENAQKTESLDEFCTIISKTYGNTTFKIWTCK
jgi:16S rRNA (guanine966-N2)-methyltransferase